MKAGFSIDLSTVLLPLRVAKDKLILCIEEHLYKIYFIFGFRGGFYEVIWKWHRHRFIFLTFTGIEHSLMTCILVCMKKM
jgi:hypothetical protein